MLLFVPPGKQDELRQVLRPLIYVPFKFECSGSQIVFFDPESDYADDRVDPDRPLQFVRELGVRRALSPNDEP
jgi:D-glycero-alpha-D-manno-heptose-7-phosphate kinase